jgi:fumarate reductase (CoM/CoB) subunit A
VSTPRELQVDVLVVGGGLAALRAAIAARREGASVAVAIKGKLGRSGSSAMTSGGYAVVLPELETGDSLATHYDDTVRGGAYVGDPKLIRILVEEGPARAREMEQMGSAFLKNEAGQYEVSPSGDHSVPRAIVPEHHIGTDLTIPMAEHAAALGVQALEFTMALELLVDDGRVVGAICLDVQKQELVVVRAGATVLGTGGCGRLFPITSNPRDVTGDGFSLAYRAGAAMRDMEFIQFYPWRCIDPFSGSRVAIQPSTFALGGQLFNSLGERFMFEYDPVRGESTTRDVAARGIFDQIRKGLDVRSGVRLDISMISEADFKRSNPKVWRGLQNKAIDYRTYEFIVAPEAHYWMGGVVIDEHARSSVDGLFAAGEVAGGIQGANRLNSNATPETQVFGERGGRLAAQQARGRAVPAPTAQVERWQRILADVQSGSGELLADPRPVLSELQQKMWLTLGIVRDGSAMRDGLAYVRELRARLERMRPTEVAALRDWSELQFLCDVGEMGLTAALLRVESRGAHFRDDYPRTDDATWRRTILLRHEADDEPAHWYEPIPAEQPAAV